MEPETQTTTETSTEPQVVVSEPETQTATETGASTEPQVVVPVEIREMTRFETDKGNIHIIHEITLGDLLVSTSLIAILIFMVFSRLIRR